MKRVFRNQRGAVLVVFVLLLIVLLGFTALAWEAGKWYLVKAETSKAVDAASLAGAKNISNPYVNLETLTKEFAEENFCEGYLGTTSREFEFDGSRKYEGKIKVTGSSATPALLARLFGINTVSVGSYGVAAKKEVEIMLVLDRSGSMSGTPLRDLKTAAINFVNFFKDTQDKDKMGLISFATGVTVDQQLGNNYVDAMKSKINAMTAVGATNAEDAIDQADGPKGFTDQTGIPGDRRVQQFLVFFSDGNPTAFRNIFTYNGTDYDAVVAGTGQHCDDVYTNLGKTDSETWLSIDPRRTGDGKTKTSTSCKTCSETTCSQNCKDNKKSGYLNTRWKVLEGIYGAGMAQQYCNCDVDSSYVETTLANYICRTARQMAIDHAQELKDNYVKIYTIGLGDIDRDFLAKVASGSGYEYYTPTSDQLAAIFQKIAKEIKLRLVE